MAVSSPRTISEWSACTSPSANDVMLCQGNALANTFSITLTDLFGNTNLDTKVLTLVVTTNSTPGNSTVGGYTNNSIWADDDYIYVAISDGTIKRVAISTFP